MSKVQAFVVGIILLLIFSIVFMPYYSDIPLIDQAGYFLCAGGLVFFAATNMIFDTLFFTHSPSNSNELDPIDTKSNGSSENSGINFAMILFIVAFIILSPFYLFFEVIFIAIGAILLLFIGMKLITDTLSIYPRQNKSNESDSREIRNEISIPPPVLFEEG